MNTIHTQTKKTVNQTRRGLLSLVPGALALSACTAADQDAFLGAVLDAAQGSGGSVGGLSQADAVSGIKVALQNGVGAAVSQVGRTNGYFGDNLIRIPLPGFLADTQKSLSRIGLSGALDDLETQLNRGAERAAPQAKQLFVSAISAMSVSDAIGIVQGGPTSATDYFESRTTPQLTSLFRPVMTDALQQAGAIQTFDRVAAQLDTNPFTAGLGANAKNDLIDHGIDKGLAGIFYYIGQEEAAIRQDPVKRTSEILRRVFG